MFMLKNFNSFMLLFDAVRRLFHIDHTFRLKQKTVLIIRLKYVLLYIICCKYRQKWCNLYESVLQVIMCKSIMLYILF